MSPHTRRLLVTFAVLGLAGVVILLMVLSPGRPPTPPPPEKVAAPDPADPTPQPELPPEPKPQPPPSVDPTTLGPVEKIEGLHTTSVVAFSPPSTLGSLEPSEHELLLEFTPTGAGLSRVTLSKYWLTAAANRQAKAHYEALAGYKANPPPLPDEAMRYVLQTAQPYRWVDAASGQLKETTIPLLACDTVVINGERVRLINAVWKETAPGAFEIEIADGDERPVARVTRRWVLGYGFDVIVRQRVVNLSDAPLEIQWIQYGPGDLLQDRSRYVDRRRFRFGYLPDQVGLPELIASSDNKLLFERTNVVKRVEKAGKSLDPLRKQELLTLWPPASEPEASWGLSWFAATNRYFALAIHPLLDVSDPGAVTGSRSLDGTVSEVRIQASAAPKMNDRTIFTGLYSPTRAVAPGGETSFDLGVYMGPLKRQVLRDEQQPMAALGMQGLILYQMSAFFLCTLCTFQWMAGVLLGFLSAVHSVIFDWGVGIIILVVVVRTLLHPLTKKGQVNMQRLGKVMQDVKPEIEKLQKKYPNDPRKLQQEQARLMRERGVNPFQFLGCLPMFLQMPIWVALYATLYFAFELRQEPAFWGVFQLFGGWPFLADLSAADHCLWEFAEPFKFWMWNITGINVLPFLMAVVFYIQQKYMSPPPSPSMTKEQIQQQKIIKVVFVVMFPLMLYSAPSGLTLYIATSSLIGIIESRYIRAHVKAMDLEPPKPKGKKGGNRKPKDLQGRLYARALERAKKKKQGPPKKYKKRK